MSKVNKVRTSFGGLSRSALMSRVRSRGNATTELRMVHLLRSAKLFGWRRHLPLPGSPDFAWERERVALFVHGCFWHGHNCDRNLVPRSNTAAWMEKIGRTRRRDAGSAALLRSGGWSVVTVWECRLRKNPASCLKRVANALFRARENLSPPARSA
jgi:DNA mismatch endonuclease, patch repair protein